MLLNFDEVLSHLGMRKICKSHNASMPFNKFIETLIECLRTVNCKTLKL